MSLLHKPWRALSCLVVANKQQHTRSGVSKHTDTRDVSDCQAAMGLESSGAPIGACEDHREPSSVIVTAIAKYASALVLHLMPESDIHVKSPTRCGTNVS